MRKDLLVLADEYAAATATFARALALKDEADSMSPIAREEGDKRAVLAEALAALDTAQPVQVNAMLVEALKDALYALQVPHVSCQQGVVSKCKCRKCVIDRGDAALTAAKQAQPERAPLMACHCFDDIARRYCIDKNRCSRCEAHGIKQGGRHD